ncbi:MAG: zinc-binding dehydrogenase, partial [Candidatus Omnitrophota bacterium]
IGSGVSGLMNIALAKLKGCRVIATDIDPYRLKKAKEFGADETIDASQEFALKADRVILCATAQRAVAQAFKSVERKGIILFFAIPQENISIPSENFWRNEITITSSYGAAPADLSEALKLIKNKKIAVNSMLTHRLPLSQIQEGFDLVSKAGKSLKVVLEN